MRATLNFVVCPQNYLKLIGETDKPLITLNKSSLDFNIIPLGVKKEIEHTMQNSGTEHGLFNIYLNFTYILTITPPMGKIIPCEYLSIFFFLFLSTAQRKVHSKFQ